MRSRMKGNRSCRDVHGQACSRLRECLKLRDHGPRCTAAVVINVLLLAAARVTSLLDACRDLLGAPSDQAVRDALAATLPNLRELERRLNEALCIDLPRAVRKRAREIAIDLTLIPYHGQPHSDPAELYHSLPKSGSSKFHAYATACIVHGGFRFTLGLTRVTGGETMAAIVQRLLRIVRQRGVKIKWLLLDKGFYSAEVMQYLMDARCPFLMPVALRGRKPSGRKPTGVRALLVKRPGWYEHALKGPRRRVRFAVCVAWRVYRHAKTAKQRVKPLLFAAWRVRGSPQQIAQIYRRRFAIESSYRQMNQARIRTSSRNPVLRLLFVGIALVLRNIWVWVHSTLYAQRRGTCLILHLEKLRLKRMLNWIIQAIQLQLVMDDPYSHNHHAHRCLASIAA